MLSRLWVAATLVAAIGGIFPSNARSQETRAELLENQRAEKAKQLAPYEPTKIERWLIYFDRHNPADWLAPHNGFYITYGYTGKPTGSGVGFGGGWRHDVLNRNGRVVFEAGHSLRGYRLVRADFSLPRLMDERLEIGIEGAHRHHPQEDFYGLGGGSLESDRTSFLYKGPDVQGRAMFTPVRWFNTGVRVGWTDVSIGSGKDKRFPTTEQLFTEATAPGLLEDPAFFYNELVAAIDTRDQRGNARAGGYYGVVWRRYHDSDLDRYSFDHMDVELQQFFPIFDKKRVIAARLQFLATTADDGQEVPFYYRPTLGGGKSLRSYADFRFRDRNVLFANIEYRWEAFSNLDMALFTDLGSVAPRFSDLELATEKAYGIGLRFNTHKTVFMRLDVAGGGREGVRTFLKFSGIF
jgi:outer membrane translocation and assembly module TamA